MSIIRAWSSLEASMLKKYNWRPDSEIGMLKIANRNNDEGHDDLEIVDHVLLPDVHHPLLLGRPLGQGLSTHRIL